MPVIEQSRERLTAGYSQGSYGPFLHTTTGIPAAGTLNGTAEKGALLINTVDGTLYQNTGTLAATVWTAR